MDAETHTEEIKTQKKKGRARMLTNLDPSMPFPEYRKSIKECTMKPIQDPSRRPKR